MRGLLTPSSSGLIQTATAFIIWGLFPIYWGFLGHIAAGEVMAHRVVWSFVFLLLITLYTRRIAAVAVAMRHKKTLLLLMTTACLISGNWLTYIWAVSNGYVIESSMGYYINPLVSMFLGAVFLNERLRRVQYIAIGFALLGVLVITVTYGRLPIIALGLAFSFGLYGLLRKKTDVDGQTALLIETGLALIPALAYLCFWATDNALFTDTLPVVLLLIGGGIATSLPLIFLGNGLKVLTLSTVGFLQYISPSLQLVIGIFLFHEDFSGTQLISFGLIWVGLIIYSGEALFNFKQKSAKLPHK